jgi:hypothetical protein
MSEHPLTTLQLIGAGVPPYSARDVQQTIEPIDQGMRYRRTLNGKFVPVSADGFRRYRTTLSCEDMDAPALGDIFAGIAVEMWCVHELAIEGDVGSAGLERPAVPGSIRVENGFTFYKPILHVYITGWNYQTNEREQVVGWSMSAEEIGDDEVGSS